MEKKKFDYNSIIGFALIFVIIFWMMMNNKENEAKEQQTKAKTEKAVQAKPTQEVAKTVVDTSLTDSVSIQKLQGTLGSFAYSATLPSAKENFTTLENEYIKLIISNRGGYISEAKLKNFKRIDKNSKELVALIKDNNANFNLQLLTKDNRTLNTSELFFEPTLTQVEGSQILSMKLYHNNTNIL